MAINGNQWQSPEAEQLEEHLEGEEERDDETDGLELRRIPVGRGEREFRQEERAVLSTGMCGEGVRTSSGWAVYSSLMPAYGMHIRTMLICEGPCEGPESCAP